jgi:hypothetical protein
MNRFLFLVAGAMCLCGAARTASADTPIVHLARDGKALLSVTIGPKASAAVKESARELATYLSRISGDEFKVMEGDGSAGIVLGRPKDFENLPFAIEFGGSPFEREDYLLRSDGRGLYLLGATDQAVSHAVWDLLHRLGYRQFFPGETWEVVPALPDIRIAIDQRESPSFHARRIWYNWGLWGYNDEPYRQWCQRNRAVKGFDLQSGHAYEGIIAANRAEFDKHPEFYALVQGERKLRPDVKFCIANPALRKLVVRGQSCGVRQAPGVLCPRAGRTQAAPRREVLHREPRVAEARGRARPARVPSESTTRQHLDGPERRR